MQNAPSSIDDGQGSKKKAIVCRSVVGYRCIYRLKSIIGIKTSQHCSVSGDDSAKYDIFSNTKNVHMCVFKGKSVWYK